MLSLATGACTPQLLDADQLERRLSREISERLDVANVAVECPDDAEARQGETLACVARAPGETQGLRIQVTQLDGDGNVVWEIAGPAE